MNNTASKYFDITIRIDQVVALVKVLEERCVLDNLVGGGVITKQESRVLKVLRTQIDIELSDRRQDDVAAVQSMDSSSSDNERELEHPTDAVNVDGEVQGRYWLGKEKGRVPPI